MPCILVIYHDEQVRRLIRLTLEQEGYQVVEAGDGATGLRAFRNQVVDVVISDLFLPNQQGLETIRSLFVLRPDLPVIAIGGGGSEGGMHYLPLAKKLGARHTLKKPFSSSQ